MAERNDPHHLSKDTNKRRTILKTNYMGKKYHHYHPNRDKALFMVAIALFILLANGF